MRGRERRCCPLLAVYAGPPDLPYRVGIHHVLVDQVREQRRQRREAAPHRAWFRAVLLHLAFPSDDRHAIDLPELTRLSDVHRLHAVAPVTGAGALDVLHAIPGERVWLDG